MTPKNPEFWTDNVQAEERLLNGFILYDGLPVRVIDIRTQDDNSIQIYMEKMDKQIFGASASDPLFDNFRNLPPTGWLNFRGDREKPRAIYYERKARRTRKHVLENGNTNTFELSDEGSHLVPSTRTNLGYFAYDPGYSDMCRNLYPPLQDVLDNLREGISVAISRKYCVTKSFDGFTSLFRDKIKVGYFINNESILLSGKTGYLREELMESDELGLSQIMEY